MTAADPRDFRQAFADVLVSEHGYVTVARGSSEAQIRTALASLAHLYGWQAEEEVVVPGWGRIDIILRDGASPPVLVELKIGLTKPARIRRAFQQADGYGRWWIETNRERPEVKLVGVDVDPDALAPVASAYHSVHCMAVGLFIGFLETGGLKEGCALRALRVRDRGADVERLLELHRTAQETMLQGLAAQSFVAFDMFETLTGGTA